MLTDFALLVGIGKRVALRNPEILHRSQDSIKMITHLSLPQNIPADKAQVKQVERVGSKEQLGLLLTVMQERMVEERADVRMQFLVNTVKHHECRRLYLPVQP